MAGTLARAILVCATLAAHAPPVTSQGAPTPGVAVGRRVRVFAPDLRQDRYIGRIESLDASALVLDTVVVESRFGLDPGPVPVDEFRRVTIRFADIEAIDVSAGRATRGPMIRGIVIGALAGGLFWGLGNMPQMNPGFGDFVSAAPAGMAIGGLIGGAIGWRLGTEVWAPALLPGTPPAR